MSNKHQTHPKTNPLPWKTVYSNKLEWTSTEEAIWFAAVQRVKRKAKHQ